MNRSVTKILVGGCLLIAVVGAIQLAKVPRRQRPLPRKSVTAVPQARRFTRPTPSPPPAAGDDDTPAEVVLPPPGDDRPPPPPAARYKQRAAGEWDGMLVDLATQPPCSDSAHCGLARACVDGVCTACAADSDCAHGEACVLDHCVRDDRIACRNSRACSSGAKCILSGYSPDARGNVEMSASCVSPRGGSGTLAVDGPPSGRPVVTAEEKARLVMFDDELRRAREVAPSP